jgi:hypothetical protein
MNNLFSLLPLFAEIGDNFPDSGQRMNWSDLWPYGIAAVVAAIATAIVVQVRKHNDMTLPCDDPHRLFRELCLAHKLDRGNVRLLAHLAEALRLEQPAQIFLMPAAFEPARLTASLRTRSAELKQLRERLF